MLRKVGVWGSALLASWLLVSAPAARADITLKMTVKEMQPHFDPKKLSASERKNPKLLMKKFTQKTVMTQTVLVGGDKPSEVSLPNGTRIRMTEAPGSGDGVRLHFSILTKKYAYDMDETIRAGGMAGVNGGQTESGGMLLVTFRR